MVGKKTKMLTTKKIQASALFEGHTPISQKKVKDTQNGHELAKVRYMSRMVH